MQKVTEAEKRAKNREPKDLGKTFYLESLADVFRRWLQLL